MENEPQEEMKPYIGIELNDRLEVVKITGEAKKWNSDDGDCVEVLMQYQLCRPQNDRSARVFCRKDPNTGRCF
jgi:hypothetical protein